METASGLQTQSWHLLLIRTKLTNLTRRSSIITVQLSSYSMMARKRSFDATSQEEITEAAQLNSRVITKLEKALVSNPEVDLLALFPSTYSDRLAKRKKIAAENCQNPNGMSRVVVLNVAASSKLPQLGSPIPSHIASPPSVIHTTHSIPLLSISNAHLPHERS